MNNIRNFVIISHVDHGKSTLADRILEITNTIEKRKMHAQFLDSLELERERGITIKMAPVRMIYRINHSQILSLREISRSETNPKSQIPNKPFKIQNSKFEIKDSEYILNLIDTPGHSDFSYEVSRALEAVEGAVLLVDAMQGIQAQTLANFHNAKDAGLKIIGVINKIDLVGKEEIEKISKEIANLLGCNFEEIHKVSGKTGEGVNELLETIVREIPPPKPINLPNKNIKGRALIFDSFYDNHKGVVASVRVFDGVFENSDNLYLIVANERSKMKELGIFAPKLNSANSLQEGEIGYIATGIKDPGKIKIGDTIISLKPNFHASTVKENNIRDNPRSNQRESANLALLGYKEPNPVIFVSFYPEESDEYEMLDRSLEKLKLNDSALSIEPDQNEVLGRGFKVGFLGKLHFEITAERLKREFNINIINTFPSVLYKVNTKSGWVDVVKPEDMPSDFSEILEPIIKLDIISPTKYLSDIFSIQKKFRMTNSSTETIGERVKISADMPLVELVSDFDDNLKSLSEGYASFSYEIKGYERADVVRVDMLVSGEKIAGLSRFFPRETLEREARRQVEKLKDLLPRQQYAQPVQAAAGGRIVARADIKALRKNVTGHLYGGDRTRKMKLWKKQARGKKRLKERSEATIPPNVFKELLKKE